VKQPALDFHEQQLEQQDERVSDSDVGQGQDGRVRVLLFALFHSILCCAALLVGGRVAAVEPMPGLADGSICTCRLLVLFTCSAASQTS
jgi:hypothetical protein